MYNIGVASFSGALSNDYLDKINEIGQIKLIHEDNIQQVNQEIDCVIIPDNSSDDNTMSLTLKNIIEIKAVTNKLVWVLTNEMNSIKNIVFLKLGVDGIFPINDFPEEFLLVIKNALHRQQSDRPHPSQQDIHTIWEQEDNQLGSHKIELYPSNLSVAINGHKEVSLTRLEYRAFEILYKKRNKAVTYKEIYEFVWKSELDKKQYRVANIIFHLRKKIEASSEDANIIKTVRSVGYRLS
ncbi:winged helix-turn-helix domain-containing protein [Enterococcus crotali]|uniref:winged helix-turn-helix domain-containing protein n=1 Tax=Enterococcus crotali TaxID=1453587 RepID=UPI0004717F83|nr:winged helix-turn-helix domain-containing protein [Enterococcus crotali]